MKNTSMLFTSPLEEFILDNSLFFLNLKYFLYFPNERIVIYCEDACIKDKSDIPSTFTFIYRAIQKVCLLTEG